MKYISLLFCSLLFFTSCKKDKEDLKEILDVSFQFSTKNDFTLPKIADKEVEIKVDSFVTVTTPSILNSAPDEFKKNNADINKLKSLTIENVQLIIKTPSAQTFAFMKSIEIYMGSAGKGEKIIARKYNINTIPTSNTLQLDALNADIADYLKGPNYYLKIRTSLAKTYTKDIAINCEVKYLAVANPLN